MKKCLYCYQALNVGEFDFHQTCSKKIFGTSIQPILDFNLQETNEIAKKLQISTNRLRHQSQKL